jgi:23S rRNA-/tRNA-specific pseudouridylate synthase
MVLARTSKAASRLTQQFRERSVVKEYVAVVEGRPEKSGRLTDFLIKEDRRVRVASPGEAGARQAELDLQPGVSTSGLTAVTIRLHTGRPHQIRVQLATRGTPIVGDFRYGARRELDGKNLALHAFRLSFTHPVRGERIEFLAPVPDNWPEELRHMTAGVERPGG